VEDEADVIRVPLEGQRWIGEYRVVINSPGSKYHDTEATMFRANGDQHVTRYYDGTEELCNDADYSISKPRPTIVDKEKRDPVVDDLEGLMKKSSLK